MLRVRTTIFALACLASACAIFTGILLNEGLLEGGKMVADWVAPRWSGQQIEAAMQYAMLVSLTLIASSLTLIFTSALRAKKQ